MWLTAVYLLGKLGTAILHMFWIMFGKQYLSLRSLNDISLGAVLNHWKMAVAVYCQQCHILAEMWCKCQRLFARIINHHNNCREIQYIDQPVHIIKYNKLQIIKHNSWYLSQIHVLAPVCHFHGVYVHRRSHIQHSTSGVNHPNRHL